MLELSSASRFREIDTQALKWRASAQDQDGSCRRFMPADPDSRLLDSGQFRCKSARSTRASFVIARGTRAQCVLSSRITSKCNDSVVRI